MHYQILLDRGLLTQTEVNIVKDFDGDAYTLPLSWFVAICNEQLQSGALHPMTFKSLRDKVLLAISLLNFRTSFSAACLDPFQFDLIQNHMAMLFEVEDVPLPFA
jgi:hypothetical protein